MVFALKNVTCFFVLSSGTLFSIGKFVGSLRLTYGQEGEEFLQNTFAIMNDDSTGQNKRTLVSVVKLSPELQEKAKKLRKKREREAQKEAS